MHIEDAKMTCISISQSSDVNNPSVFIYSNGSPELSFASASTTRSLDRCFIVPARWHTQVHVVVHFLSQVPFNPIDPPSSIDKALQQCMY